MTTRQIVVVLLLTLASACGSPGPSRTAGSEDRPAVWQFDDDANLAYPTCWNCGTDFERGARSCDACDARVHIESKTIACPECSGSKVCAHCGPSRTCVACNETRACPICEGAGTWRGAACPDCEGRKVCGACCEGAPSQSCERCDDSHGCANCEGTGTIVLK